MSFRLKKLYLYKHPILGSTSLTFCNDEILKSNNEIYNTVIIGANGIGKSYILKAIIEIFNFIHLRLSDSNDSNNLPYKFELTYYINGDKCVLSSMPKDMEVVGRGEQYNVYHYFNDKQTPLLDCKLPIRLIASSMTINDKFKAKSDDFYRYNGIRNENSPNTTGTRTLVRKTVNSIISCISYKNKFREELKCLLSKLGLQEKMTISYGMRHKEVFLKSNITPDLLSDIFNNREKYFPLRETDIWGKTFFLKVKEQPDKIKIITDFLSRVATKNYKRKSDQKLIQKTTCIPSSEQRHRPCIRHDQPKISVFKILIHYTVKIKNDRFLFLSLYSKSYKKKTLRNFCALYFQN